MEVKFCCSTYEVLNVVCVCVCVRACMHVCVCVCRSHIWMGSATTVLHPRKGQ